MAGTSASPEEGPLTRLSRNGLTRATRSRKAWSAASRIEVDSRGSLMVAFLLQDRMSTVHHSEPEAGLHVKFAKEAGPRSRRPGWRGGWASRGPVSGVPAARAESTP